jgi:hypothetical protein
MKFNSKLLLILPLLMLFVLIACDSDSDGIAQDMTDSACPCFSAQVITDDAMGKTFDGCSFMLNDLNLTITLFDGNNPALILANCDDADFGSENCFCSDMVRDVQMSGLTKEQFFDCTAILTDAIVGVFGQASMDMCLISNIN